MRRGPCPFCGTIAIIAVGLGKHWKIECIKKTCKATGPGRLTSRAALAAWNDLTTTAFAKRAGKAKP